MIDHHQTASERAGQMHDHDHERLYGTQEAAKALGLHRSTINVAVRKRLLIPDERTPGGHLRFCRATLDAFRERLTAGPATGNGAATNAVCLLAELCDLVAREVSLDLLGAHVVAELPRALPGIEMCAIARVAAESQDRLAPQIIASSQLPDEVWSRFEQLKTTFRFAITTVLRTLRPEYCEDTSAAALHTGTLELRQMWALGSYAALPAIAAGRSVGALVCAGPTPRQFTDDDRALLSAVAGLLSVAVARSASGDHSLANAKEQA